jgi:hypothetical protein
MKRRHRAAAFSLLRAFILIMMPSLSRKYVPMTERTLSSRFLFWPQSAKHNITYDDLVTDPEDRNHGQTRPQERRQLSVWQILCLHINSAGSLLSPGSTAGSPITNIPPPLPKSDADLPIITHQSEFANSIHGARDGLPSPGLTDPVVG